MKLSATLAVLLNPINASHVVVVLTKMKLDKSPASSAHTDGKATPLTKNANYLRVVTEGHMYPI